ncbi:hypothetical protein BH11PLA2_BH11PLA2_12530 [soil metagenome]
MVKVIESSKTTSTCDSLNYSIAYVCLCLGNYPKCREKASAFAKQAIESCMSQITLSFAYSTIILADLMDASIDQESLRQKINERLDDILSQRPINFDFIVERIEEYEDTHLIQAHKSADAKYASKKILYEIIRQRPERTVDKLFEGKPVSEFQTEISQRFTQNINGRLVESVTKEQKTIRVPLKKLATQPMVPFTMRDSITFPPSIPSAMPPASKP